MKYEDLSLLANLLVITKEALRTYEDNDARLDFNIKYWSGKGKIIPIKKGMYVLRERWERETDKDAYREYLANKLYEPSYLSAEYVMNKSSLLSESVSGITAVTTRKTNSFNNRLGNFYYYSLAPALFTGFDIKPFYFATIFVASPAKATFDYLYLRFIKNAPINEQIIAELRINWENLAKAEFLQIKYFSSISKSKRMLQVCHMIEKMYYA